MKNLGCGGKESPNKKLRVPLGGDLVQLK